MPSRLASEHRAPFGIQPHDDRRKHLATHQQVERREEIDHRRRDDERLRIALPMDCSHVAGEGEGRGAMSTARPKTILIFQAGAILDRVNARVGCNGNDRRCAHGHRRRMGQPPFRDVRCFDCVFERSRYTSPLFCGGNCDREKTKESEAVKTQRRKGSAKNSGRIGEPYPVKLLNWKRKRIGKLVVDSAYTVHRGLWVRLTGLRALLYRLIGETYMPAGRTDADRA